METKYCPRCETNLPVQEFYKNKAKKDGLQVQCKSCIKGFVKTSYYRYRESRLETTRIWKANWRAERYGAKSTLTVKEWLEILNSYEGKCAYCSDTFSGIDHVTPFSRGGENTKENVVPTCSSCNHKKRHFDGSYKPTHKPLANAAVI